MAELGLGAGESGTAAVLGPDRRSKHGGPGRVLQRGGGAGFLIALMPRVDPLKRLREIRDVRARADDLIPEREEMIAWALRQGSSERKIADAAGLSQPRIHEISREVLDE